MKLTEFIRIEMASILDAWERNAERAPGEDASVLDERRAHARKILQRVAEELEQAPAGSDSRRPLELHSPVTGSTAPAREGSKHRGWVATVDAATEFRVLRSSVVRLWGQLTGAAQSRDLEEIIRFSELLDQALTESLAVFAVAKRKQDRLLTTMLSSLPDPSYVLDLNGRFTYVNRAMADLCDTPVEKLIGKNFADLGLQIQDYLHSQLQHVLTTKERLRGEIAIDTPSGESQYYEYISVPVIDNQGKVEAIAVSARDCTERRASEAQVWQHANYDPLTNLPNRRLFQDRLEQHFKHCERTGAPFALLFVDLDHFKQINDQWGHDAGDLLLTSTAMRLTSCVRETDTVARLGGDEFTILLLDIEDRQQIEDIARNVLLELSKPFYLGDEICHVSSSIGISRFPQDASTAHQLLKNADQAMYLAKKGGRNRFCCFEQIMEQAASERLQMIVDLRNAMEQDQLQLFYQPIIDLADGRISKAEALLRWAHPDRGLLRPGDFLKLAEETGLINDIESWAFVEASSCSKRWSSIAAPSFQVTLNTSSLQFRHQNPEVPWESHLRRLGLDGSSITMELPEKVLSQGSKTLRERLYRLQEAGVQLAMDDFGTGYASMLQLKRFNVCFLKLDRAIVRDLDEASQPLAEAIILMAHKLGLQVIAEGVETREQWHCLQKLGCDFAQGYFFSEPLPPAEFEALLKSDYRAA